MKVRKNMIAVMILVCMGCSGCAKGQPKADAGNEIRSEDVRNAGNETESGDTGSTAGRQDFPETFQETINGVVFDTVSATVPKSNKLTASPGSEKEYSRETSTLSIPPAEYST